MGPVPVEVHTAPTGDASSAEVQRLQQVRWSQLRATVHRLDRAAVFAESREILRGWRDDSRRAEVMFLLGQVSERVSPSDRSPPDPAQAAVWYDLAASALPRTDPRWVSYELAAVTRRSWQWDPGDSRQADLLSRLEIAETSAAAASPLVRAQILESRVAVALRRRDLDLAESVCRRLCELRDQRQNTGLSTPAEDRRLREICQGSATALLFAVPLAPADQRLRQIRIERLGRLFDWSEQELLGPLEMSARRAGAITDACGPRPDPRSIETILFWMMHVIIVLGGFVARYISLRK